MKKDILDGNELRKTMPHKYTQNYPSERKDYPGHESAPKKEPKKDPKKVSYHPTVGNPEDGGKLSPADAERISSEDFPSPLEEEENHPKKKAA